MNILKELKFLGLVIFIIFAILLLFSLVSLVTFIRFDCNQLVNYLKNIKYEGNIKTIIPKLQTGDIIIFGDKVNFNKNLTKKDCFLKSRINFVPKTNLFTHVGIIYRKNNQVYLIESIFREEKCKRRINYVNENYIDGLRIVDFKKVIEEYKLSSKKNAECNVSYGVRFINRKFNQNELNRRFENEFNIIADTKFNEWNTVEKVAIPGWFIYDIPRSGYYGLELYLPNDDKDTYFCSEIIALLLQRIGIMKRTYRSRMFYPADFNGYRDSEMFPKNTYSKIKMYY